MRIIVHSRFDAICQDCAAAEDMHDVICRGTTASIPPAEFRLYHVVGSIFAGQHYAPAFSSSKRSSAKASTRRADKDQGADKDKKYKQSIVIQESFLLNHFLGYCFSAGKDEPFPKSIARAISARRHA